MYYYLITTKKKMQIKKTRYMILESSTSDKYFWSPIYQVLLWDNLVHIRHRWHQGSDGIILFAISNQNVNLHKPMAESKFILRFCFILSGSSTHVVV